MDWKLAVILALLMFLIIFAVQNYEVVEIQVLFWSFQTSRAIIIFSTLFAGIAIGWLVSYLKNR
ncbi:MAG: LapA family protein [Candidatus Omnitrophica bacterium]|nr:LapA family protein [Candidatus Omnitrophota bacterium]